MCHEKGKIISYTKKAIEGNSSCKQYLLFNESNISGKEILQAAKIVSALFHAYL